MLCALWTFSSFSHAAVPFPPPYLLSLLPPPPLVAPPPPRPGLFASSEPRLHGTIAVTHVCPDAFQIRCARHGMLCTFSSIPAEEAPSFHCTPEASKLQLQSRLDAHVGTRCRCDNDGLRHIGLTRDPGLAVGRWCVVSVLAGIRHRTAALFVRSCVPCAVL